MTNADRPSSTESVSRNMGGHFFLDGNQGCDSYIISGLRQILGYIKKYTHVDLLLKYPVMDQKGLRDSIKPL